MRDEVSVPHMRIADNYHNDHQDCYTREETNLLRTAAGLHLAVSSDSQFTETMHVESPPLLTNESTDYQCMNLTSFKENEELYANRTVTIKTSAITN